MGQPRAEGPIVPAFVPPDPEWLGRLLGEFVKRIHTPAPAADEQTEQPRQQPEPDESLKAQAELAYNQAVSEGRATPRLRSPSPVPRSEALTMIETPEELARAAEAGARRAHARLARIAGRPDVSE
jgi:hypothetical protein